MSLIFWSVGFILANRPSLVLARAPRTLPHFGLRAVAPLGEHSRERKAEDEKRVAIRIEISKPLGAKRVRVRKRYGKNEEGKTNNIRRA